MSKIPIFIITKDRVTVLKKSIDSFLKLGCVELVIQDNGSTYPPMIEYLKELEDGGVKIYRNPNANGSFTDISESVRATIADWYQTNNSDYYIVTDPDIELESPSEQLIPYYVKVLQQHPLAKVVGPMLRTDDLPDCFRMKDEMIESHRIQFWGRKPHVFEGVNIQEAAIDTTFGMYRKEFVFKRLNLGIRVHEPHMARHLDWYIDTENLNEEEQYYKDHASSVSTLTEHMKRYDNK